MPWADQTANMILEGQQRLFILTNLDGFCFPKQPNYVILCLIAMSDYITVPGSVHAKLALPADRSEWALEFTQGSSENHVLKTSAGS